MIKTEDVVRILAEIAIQGGEMYDHQANALRDYRDQAPDATDDLNDKITSILTRIGVPCSVLGFRYLREAIALVVKDYDLVYAITSELYPKVAEIFNVTPGRVERAIRHAIEAAWDRGGLDDQAEIFGNTVSPNKGKPTNSEFIALIADRIIRGKL